MVQQHIGASDDREEVGGLLTALESGVGDRDVRDVLELGTIERMDHEQRPEIERAGDAVHVVRLEIEFVDEQVEDLGSDVGVDLETHGTTEATATQFELDRLEQIVGLLLLEREVGVASHTERVVRTDRHAGEQHVEVGGDHLLERHEPHSVGQCHESREQVRHLHPCEPALAVRRIGDDDGEVEREVGDVGEGMSRIDRERREHGEDAVVEHGAEVFTIGLVEVVP